ncbi:orotidine-5'-phosphate decarboxylase [Patescibacteria group bacterium]|nr:orotidine-5'-phosphate decarboxylase [Patescibacteria group bacterium]
MKQKLIELLFKYGVIGTTFKTPITFKSGTKSPMYCDFRIARAHHDLKKVIIKSLEEKLKEMGIDVIMSVYSGAALYGEIISYTLETPAAYVRPDAKAKDYGLQKLIEGTDVKGKRVVLIEDLISTGGSMITNAEIIKKAGATKVHCISIFSYEILGADKNFKNAGLTYESLLNIYDLLPVLEKSLPSADYEKLMDWVNDPVDWFNRHKLEFDFGFLTQLRKSADQSGSIISFGLDPVIDALPQEYQSMGIDGFVAFMEEVFKEMEKANVSPGMFKPNLAWWQVHDNPYSGEYRGSNALVHMLGLINKYFVVPICLDYKKADIGTSSEQWAQYGFGSWLSNSVTVHTYMGSDSVGPFLNYCNPQYSRGAYLLVKTTNPGAKDLELKAMLNGKPVYEEVAENLISWSKNRPGVGAVVAGNSAEELAILGAKFAGKDIPLLIPGVGKSQGGDASEVAQILRDSGIELALTRINLSSGLTRPWYKKGEENPSTKECINMIVKTLDDLNKSINFQN